MYVAASIENAKIALGILHQLRASKKSRIREIDRSTTSLHKMFLSAPLRPGSHGCMKRCFW
jgi:hypothetical protein